MLDIVHYFFESDSLNTEEEQDAKRKMRQAVYGQLYDRPYSWGNQGGSREFGTQETASGDFSNGPQELTHKPYIPPTPVDVSSAKPFGNVLDAPLG